MRRSILLLGALSLLASCHKSSSPNTNPVSGLVIQAVYGYPSTQGRTVINLGYNAARQVTYLSYYAYDTSGGISYLDTGAYHFTINASTNLPAFYTFTGYKSDFGSSDAETHNLFFDANGRMIRDTMLTGQVNPGDSSANYFSYTTNQIVIRDYSLYAWDTVNTGYGWGAIGLDTIILVNGNVTSRNEYSQNVDTWILDNSTDMPGYSNFANPFYNVQVSNAIGAFFLDQNIVDFLSKQLPSTGVAHWTTDASGKVVAGLGTDGTTETFTYQ